MNDTCFGPLWDIEPYMKIFDEDESIDFWGWTNHRACKNLFSEHIQSYFITFKNNVIKSKVFQEFWQNVKNLTEVIDVILQYETRLTKILMDKGFNYKTYLNTKLVDIHNNDSFDVSYFHLNFILNEKTPFIKVKPLLKDFNQVPNCLFTLKKISNYPLNLMLSHLSDFTYPDNPYLLSAKYLNNVNVDLSSKKIAIHLHVYYVDLLFEFLVSFKNFNFKYDLIITTDSSDKEKEISKILFDSKASAKIILTGNCGRDVIPLLKLKDVLVNYDFIGHFHTKKCKNVTPWIGEFWRRELIDMLIKPANKILSNLDDENIGLVISDMPTYFRYQNVVTIKTEKKLTNLLNDFWNKMNLKKDIDFTKFTHFVMSYGTFVWFKYDALKPMFDLDLSQINIPKEPISQFTVLHVIEKILIYLAWAQGYDFKISKNENAVTAFVEKKLEKKITTPYKLILKKPIYLLRDSIRILRKSVKVIFKKSKNLI